MDEELKTQLNNIIADPNIDVERLLEKNRITISNNMLYRSNESAMMYLITALIGTIGLDKTKLVAELIHPLQVYIENNLNNFMAPTQNSEDEETAKLAEMEQAFEKSGVNLTTFEADDFKADDEERLKNFILALSDKNKAIDVISFLEFKMKDFPKEKVQAIINKAGQYLLYKELMNRIVDSDVIRQILYFCRIEEMDIPANVSDRVIDEIIFNPHWVIYLEQLQGVNVDNNCPTYFSIDGVLYRNENSKLLYYPPNKKGRTFSIPENINGIDERAFLQLSTENTELEEIIVDAHNNNFSSIDGVLYSKDVKRLIVYPPGKKDELYRVPSTVEHIYPEMRCVDGIIKKVEVPITIEEENDPTTIVLALSTSLTSSDIELIPPSFEDAIAFGYVDKDVSSEEQAKQYSNCKKIIKLSNILVLNNDYDSDFAYNYVEIMFNMFGEDETREILKVPDKISENDPHITLDVEYYYDKKYQLKGPLPITVDILKYLYGQIGKKESQKLFRKINTLLENKNSKALNETFDEVLIKFAKELNIDLDEDNWKSVYTTIQQKEYRRNEPDIRKIIADKVNSNASILNGHLGIIAGVMEKVINRNYIQEGNIDDALKLLEEEFQRRDSNGNLTYQGILSSLEEIKNLLKEIYSEKASIVQNNVNQKMQEAKQIIGKRWISRLLACTDKLDLDKMNQKEMDGFVEYFWGKLSQTEWERFSRKVFGDNFYSAYYELKPDAIPVRVSKFLGSSGFAQIMTYNKAETMFSSMEEPYSQYFIKWFLDHKLEVMERPELFISLPTINTIFDEKIVNDSVSRTMFDNGLIDADYVYEKYKQYINQDKTPIHDKFSYWINKTGMYINDQIKEQLEAIYEQTKKREKSYIPSAEKTKKVGKVTYRGRILRADDPLNILIGNATNCCQKINDVGENTMRHASMEDTGRTFVVEEIDEYGNSKIVSQSWVWRNNGTLCFDNIEIPYSEHMELKFGHSETHIAKQKAILDVYQGAANIALEKDNKKFDELLKKGKITQEQYDAYKLSLVTVGTGLNDLRNLNQF